MGVNCGDWKGSMPPATQSHWSPAWVKQGRPTQDWPSGFSLGHLRTHEPPWQSWAVVQPVPQVTVFPQLSVDVPHVAEPQLLVLGVQQAPLERQVWPGEQAPLTVAQLTD